MVLAVIFDTNIIIPLVNSYKYFIDTDPQEPFPASCKGQKSLNKLIIRERLKNIHPDYGKINILREHR